MKYFIGFIVFIIFASIFDDFNCRARKLEERMNKLEETLGSNSEEDTKDE